MEQKWFGWVEEIHDKSFSVRLNDLTPENRIDKGLSGTYEIAEISYDDITEKDRETIKLGSIFYLTINDNGLTIEFAKPLSKNQKEKKTEMAIRFYQSILNSNLFDNF